MATVGHTLESGLVMSAFTALATTHLLDAAGNPLRLIPSLDKYDNDVIYLSIYNPITASTTAAALDVQTATAVYESLGAWLNFVASPKPWDFLATYEPARKLVVNLDNTDNLREAISKLDPVTDSKEKESPVSTPSV